MLKYSLFALGALSLNCIAHAEPTVPQLAQQVADRAANEGRVGTMHFTLTNASGKTRKRTALMAHSETQDTNRLAIFFTAPSMISETAFLSYDHSSVDDENWLFLPATERVRRLPVSERGDYFMGTDMTFGDVKDNFKFALSDWNFTAAGADTHKGQSYAVLMGKPKTGKIAKELGYASFRALIDEGKNFPILIEFTDADGEALKRVEVTDLQKVGGAWTAMKFTVAQVQTGHRTDIDFTNMRFVPDLDESVFDPTSLAYGVPDVG